jgi:hypothetical protein
MKNPLHCLLTCIVLFIFHQSLSANELYPVSLTERVSSSTVIAEGKVVSQFCFIDPRSNNIYTSNRIAIYRLFKGSISTDEIEIVTHGGMVGERAQTYSAYLQLYTGQTGIFFCMPSTLKKPANARLAASYMVYSSMQGFIEYDAARQKAADPFTTYKDVESAITSVKRLTNKDVQVREYTEIATNGVNGTTATPTITGINPTTITAGTNNVLTITGTGFNAIRGTGRVQFRNADNGGAGVVNPFPIDYISWTDTEIQVRVPSVTLQNSGAGSGTVQVINSTDAGIATSSQSLLVSYAYINLRDNATNPTIIYKPSHYDDNGTGGYTFELEQNFFANTAAKEAFGRAMQTWVCATKMNWSIGDTTNIDSSGADFRHVIRFEIGTELPSGVLGVCITNFLGCGTAQLFAADIDIVFDNATSGSYAWQFGPALAGAGRVDFESIALHELGHAQQLGHVILPGAVMHYAFTTAQNVRALSGNDIAGGSMITAIGFAANTCGAPPMTPGVLSLSSLQNPDDICSQSPFFYKPTGGTYVSYSWTRPVVAGISNPLGSGTGNVNEILVNSTASPITVNYNYLLDSPGCNSGSEVVSVVVNPINLLLSGTAGGAQVCANYTVQATGTTYSDSSCDLIARVVPSGGAQVAGIINVCSKLEASVPAFNGQPYCARHYDIEPAAGAPTATGTVTLYYTQAEFTAYNASNGAFPDLPANTADAAGIANLRVTQFHGTSATGAPGSYSGATDFIDPLDANIVWNGTANRWEITFNVTGFSGFFVHSGATALPLRLLQFSGTISGNNNLLQWTTASEQQTAYFDIERSADGVNFTVVGRVQASGSTIGEKIYQYRDDVSKAPQALYYYRLKMTDLNHQFTHSPTVLLKRSNLVFLMKAMQNPFSRQLQVSITSPQQQRGVLLVTDINGRQLSQKTISLPEGSTIMDIPGVQQLKAGTYLLTLITDTEKQVIKVLKQQ